MVMGTLITQFWGHKTSKMKTATTQSKNNAQSAFTKVMRNAFLALAFSGSLLCTAQKNTDVHYALNADLTVSGNGHGACYYLAMEYRNYRNVFSFGPGYQYAAGKINSVRLTYSRLLTGYVPHAEFNMTEDEKEQMEEPLKVELRLFAAMQYYHKASLSNTAMNMERQVASEFSINPSRLSINTGQATVGIGSNFKLTSALLLRTYMGVSYYHHFNMSNTLYHEKSAPVLSVGIGLGFLK